MKRKSIAEVLANVTGAQLVGQGTYVAPGKPRLPRAVRATLAFTIGDQKAKPAWTAATPALIHSGLEIDPGDRVVVKIIVTPKRERRRG